MSFDMNIGEYIKKRREGLGFSQRQVAMLSGLSNATISRIENGGVVPDTETLVAIAPALKVAPETLFEAAGYIEKSPDGKSRVIRIPVLGRVAAGIPIEAIEDIIDYEELPAAEYNDGDYFGLRIKGDSMEPRITDGDVVIVRKQPDVESGEIAVILVNGYDATVKRLVKHENGVSLISLNSAYPPTFYTCDEVAKMPVEVIGKVVELRGKF